jgi:hypothetical protein
MRYWLSLAMVPLASCGNAAEPAPRETAAPTQAEARLPAPLPSAGQVLLDGLVRPRQHGAYAPRDDCAKLPGAAAFRQALAVAVLRRDAGAIAAMALPDVRLGFGGDDGRQRLREKLGENGGALMQELEALLRLGCAADAQGGITMPWYFAQDFGDLDTYSAMLVTGADVPLHAAADAASPVKQRLSWDVVALDKGLFPDKPFQQVTATGGAKGYVATAKLRSLLDYRLLAARQNGQWKISALVAGD